VYTYIRTKHIHAHIYIKVHTKVHAYITCRHAYMYKYIHESKHAGMQTCIHTHIHKYMHTYIRTYIHTMSCNPSFKPSGPYAPDGLIIPLFEDEGAHQPGKELTALWFPSRNLTVVITCARDITYLRMFTRGGHELVLVVYKVPAVNHVSRLKN